MNIENRLRRWFKFRFAVLYPFGLLAVFFSIPSDSSIKAGIGFVMAGLLIRVWANGYAIKLERLTTSGPYAFIRHPLYLGTLLLVIGFVVVLRIHYIIGILVIALMVGVYSSTIRKEELMLEKKFKDKYSDYKNKIPAIFPAFVFYSQGEKWPFSFRRLIKSQEYKLFFWMLILLIGFHLKDEFMVEHEKIDTKIWILIIIALILGILDLIGEVTKKTRKATKSNIQT